jgi:hypothetical protein
MSANDWNWWLAIVGTVASIAGVVFSILAWVQAGRAKRAAQEAASAVRLRNLSHDYLGWSRDAQELLRAVRELHFEQAQRSATDLLGNLSHNRGWQAGLHREGAAGQIDKIIRLLSFVDAYLTEQAVFESKQVEILRQCREIFRRLNEMSGSFDAEVENS